jgi:hypothetical protein
MKSALYLATHDSGPGRLATPFLYNSFQLQSRADFPGAFSTLQV